MNHHRICAVLRIIGFALLAAFLTSFVFTCLTAFFQLCTTARHDLMVP